MQKKTILIKVKLCLLIEVASLISFSLHAAPSCPVRIMEFNIEEEGVLVNFDKVVEAIKLADADVVALEEAEGSVSLLAKLLSYPYFDSKRQLLSRYPLLNADAENLYTFIEVEPQSYIAISNVHLPSDPYGPFEFNNGLNDENVQELEHAVRLSFLENHLIALPQLIKQNIPVFLLGDFNSPSHLDWNTKSSQNFNWPVSKAIETAGFKDSYRELYPNAQTHPGTTWWARRPRVEGWNPEESDPEDRIDFIYYAGPVEPIDSYIIGEENVRDISIALSPWPSDHRAIVTKFLVQPCPMQLS